MPWGAPSRGCEYGRWSDRIHHLPLSNVEPRGRAGDCPPGVRTPRPAALAVIAFSRIVAIAVIVLRVEIPASPSQAGQRLADPSRRDVVLVALALIPFAGIAFLWFIGAGRQLTDDFMHIAMRMAAVFTIAGSTILGRTGPGPRWFAVMGYAIGAVLLVTVSFFGWLELVFPLLGGQDSSDVD